MFVFTCVLYRLTVHIGLLIVPDIHAFMLNTAQVSFMMLFLLCLAWFTACLSLWEGSCR